MSHCVFGKMYFINPKDFLGSVHTGRLFFSSLAFVFFFQEKKKKRNERPFRPLCNQFVSSAVKINRSHRPRPYFTRPDFVA